MNGDGGGRRVINPALIARCDQLARAYRDVRDYAPLAGFFRDRPAAGELFERQERLDRLAALDRFRIGFVGPSQVGKSFTVANLLDVSQKDAPTPTGGGGPRTSAVTRVHAAAPELDHEIILRFLTRKEYDARKRALCEELDLDAQRPDGDLIAALRPTPGERRPGEEMTRRSLLRLLEARREHGDAIDSGEAPGEYDSRDDYVCHPIDDDPKAQAKLRYALLRQATVAFATRRLHEDLEVIDLPGLDVANGADRLLTLSFLPELNGVFIFQTSRQVHSSAAAELLRLLSRDHRASLGQRVWAVFTMFDALNPSLYDGVASGQTIFDQISGFLDDNGIGLERALFIGNQIHQNLLERKRSAPEEFPGDDLPPPIPWDYANSVMIPRDAAGEPIIPDNFQDSRHKKLLGAYQEVLRDGGVGRLRRVILGEVVDAVRAEVERQIEDELRLLGDSMKELLGEAVRDQNLDPEDLVRAARWEQRLESTVLPPIQRDEATEKPLAAALREDLTALLREIAPGTLPAVEFAAIHGGKTTALRNKGLQTARNQRAAFFAAVDDLIDKIDVDPLRGGPLLDPRQWWRDESAADRAGESWFSPVLDSFQTDKLDMVEPNPTPGRLVPLDDYLWVMDRKIDRVANEFATVMIERASAKLDRLRGELRRLGSETVSIDQATRELVNRTLTLLKESTAGGARS